LSAPAIHFRDSGAARAGGYVLAVAAVLYFLEPLIFANVPAFLWLGYVGVRVARAAAGEVEAATGRSPR